jgi:hypothetical protein
MKTKEDPQTLETTAQCLLAADALATAAKSLSRERDKLCRRAQQTRSRFVGAAVDALTHGRLARLAKARGITVGELAREILTANRSNKNPLLQGFKAGLKAA